MIKNQNIKTALIVIDFQKEFINGKINLPYSENLIYKINSINTKFDLVCFTKNVTNQKPLDSNKLESDTNEILISDVDSYCIENTTGCELADGMEYNKNIFVRNYSNTFSVKTSVNSNNETLYQVLNDNEITHVFICGLLSDYSVKYSVYDLMNDYNVYVLIDILKTKSALQKLINDFLLKKNISIVSSVDINEILNGLKRNPGNRKEKKSIYAKEKKIDNYIESIRKYYD